MFLKELAKQAFNNSQNTHCKIDKTLCWPIYSNSDFGCESKWSYAWLKTFGLLFENLVVRDLKVYTESLEGNVYHYRDKSGLEADAVIHLHDGRWGLIEIKVGGQTLIDEGAATLKALKAKINQDKMNEPAFLAIITATDPFAYQREDGICVIPIGCLKP